LGIGISKEEPRNPGCEYFLNLGISFNEVVACMKLDKPTEVSTARLTRFLSSDDGNVVDGMVEQTSQLKAQQGKARQNDRG
jgi:hypothetical protein